MRLVNPTSSIDTLSSALAVHSTTGPDRVARSFAYQILGEQRAREALDFSVHEGRVLA